MSTPVKVVAVLSARPGKAEELSALLAGMVGPSRAEQGNLQYNLWHDKSDPGRFVVEERYVDGAAAAAHHTTPHFRHYRLSINGLADRLALELEPIEVAEEHQAMSHEEQNSGDREGETQPAAGR
jgi:quinol monooxygenase YgiN